jgi:ParB-like chromosome segregation protein Spo0J
MNIEHIPLDQLTPYANNARTHSPEQIYQIANSITEFDFTNPVLIDENLLISADSCIIHFGYPSTRGNT